MSASADDAKQLRKTAERCIAGLRKLDRRDARAEATQLSAALAQEDERAAALLADAAEQFSALDLQVRERLCYLRASALSGSPDPAHASAIEAAGVLDVARWANAHAPGFRRSPSS